MEDGPESSIGDRHQADEARPSMALLEYLGDRFAFPLHTC